MNIRKCPHKLHFRTVKDWRNPCNQTDICSKTNSTRCHTLHTQSLCPVDRAQSTVRDIGDFPQGLRGAAEIMLHPYRKGWFFRKDSKDSIFCFRLSNKEELESDTEFWYLTSPTNGPRFSHLSLLDHKHI